MSWQLQLALIFASAADCSNASDFEAKHFAPGRSRFGFCRTRGRRPVLGCSRGCCSCAAWRRLRYGRATIASLSLIVLEEVDALAPARGPLTHDHKVEEIVELLRMVESAQARYRRLRMVSPI